MKLEKAAYLLLSAILLTIVSGGVYLGFFYSKLKVPYPVSKKRLHVYSSAFLPVSLKYPDSYAVQDYSKSFKALTISKTVDSLIGSLEIFHMNDLDVKPDVASAKEQFTIGPDSNPYTVLMYYPDNDAQTQSELHQIYNNLKVK